MAWVEDKMIFSISMVTVQPESRTAELTTPTVWPSDSLYDTLSPVPGITSNCHTQLTSLWSRLSPPGLYTRLDPKPRAYILQKQICCFTSYPVCRQTAVMLYVYFAICIRTPERKPPRLSYNHDLADIVTTEHLWENHHKSIKFLLVVVVIRSQKFLRVVSWKVWFGVRLLT